MHTKKETEERKEGGRKERSQEEKKERNEINLYQIARTVLGVFENISSKLPAFKVRNSLPDINHKQS